MKENPMNKNPKNLSPAIQMRVLRKMFKPQVIVTQFQISITSRLLSYSNQLICTYSNQLVLKGGNSLFQCGRHS